MQPWSIGLVAVRAIGVVVWLKLRKSNSEEIYAIVLMIETPRMLRGDIVAPAISTATGKEFSEDRLTEEKPCYFRAVVEGFEITIASTPGPYGSAKSFERDRRIHEQALLAKGAILLDIWKAPEGASKADGLPLLGKIAAELMDGETRLIYLWPHRRVNVGDEELKDRFARGEAVDGLPGHAVQLERLARLEGFAEVGGSDEPATGHPGIRVGIHPDRHKRHASFS